MATLVSDRDGKSQTASAVDAKHYPEQNETPEKQPQVSNGVNVEEIRVRAYELWCDRGCPDGSADDDWYQAERELRGGGGLERLSDQLHESSGSVQR